MNRPLQCKFSWTLSCAHAYCNLFNMVMCWVETHNNINWYACIFYTWSHIWSDVQTAELNIQVQSEQFTIDRVTAVLEWTLSNASSQYPQLLGNVSVDIVPDSGMEMLLLGNTCGQLTLLYNTLYNVSIVQPATYEQLSQAAFIGLRYSKLKLPY